MSIHRCAEPSFEHLESRMLFASTIVDFGDGGFHAVEIIDSDGSAVVVSLAGGTGSLQLHGVNLAQSPAGKTIVVTGQGLSIDGLSVDSTSGAKISISVHGGDGSTDLGDVNVSGALPSLSAKRVNLTGDLTAGDAGTIVLGSISGGSITDQGASLPLRIVIAGAASNATIDAAGSIDVLSAGSWTSSDADGITALSINKLKVNGSFDTDLHLSGGGLAILSARFGAIDGGAWDITGDVGSISAGSTSSDWSAELSGALAVLKAVSFSGDLTAYSAGRIKAAAITDAHVNLTKAYDGTDALDSLSAGVIFGSSVRTRGNIRSIKAAAVDSSIFSAGVGAADSVNSTRDFDEPTYIASFKSGAFSNSAVIAQKVGTASLGAVDDSAGSRSFFGVAAETIAALKLAINGRIAKLKGLDSSSSISDLLAGQGVDAKHFAADIPGHDGPSDPPPVVTTPNPLPPAPPTPDPGITTEDNIAHIVISLATIKTLQETAVQYSFEGAAARGTQWDPQKYFETYYQIYTEFQDTIATRNALADQASLDQVNPSVEAARTSIAGNLHYEATAIPVAAQEDGWQEDYDRLAIQVEEQA